MQSAARDNGAELCACTAILGRVTPCPLFSFGARGATWSIEVNLGARDPQSGQFVMLGKTFKGLTDKLLAWQTEKLLSLEVSRDQFTVYVRPELVVEIAFGGLQESPRYPGGLALRFARVKRYRPESRRAKRIRFRR